MEKKRKIECDCGGIFEEKAIELEKGITSEALICTKCNDTTLTKKQAIKYFNIKKMKEDLEKERKIIRIGNSTGITFPQKLTKQLFKEGRNVKLGVVDEKTLTISIV